MNPTSCRFVHVAHVVTWTAREEAHEAAVNQRLAGLPGAVLAIGHSATMTETSEGENYQFSTLITYTDWKAPGEDAEDAKESEQQ